MKKAIKINFENPIIRIELLASKRLELIALDTEQSVEKGVLPLYSPSKSMKHHRRNKEVIEQIGTGILVNIGTEYFIFTCTHVFESHGNYGILVGEGRGHLIKQFTGERFSKGNINSPFSHKSDASVFHIQSKISDSLKERAISLEDLYLELDSDDNMPFYLAVGYRSKKSRRKGNGIHSQIEAFPSNELPIKVYNTLNFERSNFFLLHYPDRIINDKLQWQISPVPRGLSGGALIRIQNTNLKDKFTIPPTTRQQLVGIVIEHYRSKHGNPGFIKCVRVVEHLRLLQQFLPDLMAEFPQFGDI